MYSDTGYFTYDYTNDGEGLGYTDFIKKETVTTLPEFADQFDLPDYRDDWFHNLRVSMKDDLDVLMKAGEQPGVKG